MSVVWSFLELGRYIPGHNCWNAHRLFHSFPFKIDFEDVYTQANAWNQKKDNDNKSRKQYVYSWNDLVYLVFSEVFRQIMTGIVANSLRSWRYCVVVEWELAAEPL